MNQRIAELQTQCIVREVRGTTAFDSYMVDRFDTEKFAELIVQECADLVDTLNEAYEAPSTAGKFIKNHFGIEIHSDKDYEIGTLEECEKFAESRRKPLGKNE